MAAEKKKVIEENSVQAKTEAPVQPQIDQEVKSEVIVKEEKDPKVEEGKVVDAVVKMKNISIKLPEDIHRKLKAKCAMDGESAGNVMKRLIAEYIKQ